MYLRVCMNMLYMRRHAYVSKLTYVQGRRCRGASVHACIYKHAYSHTHIYRDGLMHTYLCTTHAYMHTIYRDERVGKCLYTCVHTYAHTYIHTLRDEWVEKYLGNATERVQMKSILELVGFKYDTKRNMWLKPVKMANGMLEGICVYVYVCMYVRMYVCTLV